MQIMRCIDLVMNTIFNFYLLRDEEVSGEKEIDFSFANSSSKHLEEKGLAILVILQRLCAPLNFRHLKSKGIQSG